MDIGKFALSISTRDSSSGARKRSGLNDKGILIKAQVSLPGSEIIAAESAYVLKWIGGQPHGFPSNTMRRS